MFELADGEHKKSHLGNLPGVIIYVGYNNLKLYNKITSQPYTVAVITKN